MLIKKGFKFLKLQAMFPMFNGVFIGGVILLIISPLLAVLKKLGQRAFIILMCMILASVLFFITLKFRIIVDEFVDAIITANPTLIDLKSSAMTVEGYHSLAQRLGKWANSVAYLIDNPLALLFGVGVYSQGGALDGGMLRLIFEVGIPMSAYILYRVWKADMRFLLLFVLVNLTFDAYISSVVAPLLFGTYLFHLKLER